MKASDQAAATRLHQPQLSRRQCLTLLSTLVAGMGCSGDAPTITGTVTELSLDSSLVNDTYTLLIRLPPGHDINAAQRYPVIFQLDATDFGPQFDITAGYASALAEAGEMGEVIVVGVGYPYAAGLGGDRGRWRDYVTRLGNGMPGGAATFLQALQEEIFPFVESQFAIDPADRTLMGHSLGGFFTLFTLLSTATDAQPPFRQFVAADPTLGHDDLRLLHMLEEVSAQTTSLPAKLYFPIARYNGAVQQLYFEQLSSRLAERFADLQMRAAMLDTDHGGALRPSYEQGLRFLFGAQP